MYGWMLAGCKFTIRKLLSYNYKESAQVCACLQTRIMLSSCISVALRYDTKKYSWLWCTCWALKTDVVYTIPMDDSR